MDAAFVRRWMEEIASAVEARRQELTELDSAIGDGDHGVNMHRGFSAVAARLAGADAATPGAVLTTAGATLISTVGGASGPLYGTAFRHAGRALGSAETFGPADLVAALRAALAGVQALGGAAEGDKTMVDALAPALEALSAEVEAGTPLADALRRAREAAERGMSATTALEARKGRASYLGPRSVGHQDPGATSMALVFSALERAGRSLDS